MWDASFLLARWLHHHGCEVGSGPTSATAFVPHRLCNGFPNSSAGLRGCQEQSVLELGSGTGMLGLYAAQLGAAVVLTELGRTLPVTKRNVAWNGPALTAAAGRGGSATVSGLDWLDEGRRLPTVPSPSKCWDLVVGSDILYDGRCYEALASVVHEAAAVGRGGPAAVGQPSTRVVLSWSVSPNASLLNRFWATVQKKGFAIEFATRQTIDALLGEAGRALYDKHADGGDEDVSLAVLRLI